MICLKISHTFSSNPPFLPATCIYVFVSSFDWFITLYSVVASFAQSGNNFDFVFFFFYFDTQLKTGLLSLVITLFQIYFAIFIDMLPLDIEPVSIHCENLKKIAVAYFLAVCSSVEIIYIYNVGVVNFTMQEKNKTH